MEAILIDTGANARADLRHLESQQEVIKVENDKCSVFIYMYMSCNKTE